MFAAIEKFNVPPPPLNEVTVSALHTVKSLYIPWTQQYKNRTDYQENKWWLMTTACGLTGLTDVGVCGNVGVDVGVPVWC